MNNLLFEEQRVGIPPEFFPYLDFVNIGGIQQVQLAQQPAVVLENMLSLEGFEAEWDADRTVLSIRRQENQGDQPQAELTMQQIGDGDEYEFVIRGPDEEVVGLVANNSPQGIMGRLIQAVAMLWQAGQHAPAAAAPAPAAAHAPAAAAPAPQPNAQQQNENLEMEILGGRRRRRRTVRRKARKTRKAKRSNRRTLYRKRR